MLLNILIVCIIGLVIMSALVAAVVYYRVANPSDRNVFDNSRVTDNTVGCDYKILSTISSDGVRLNAYFVDNDNSNCLIVVLHGYGSQAKNLLPFINHFQITGYSVLIPDLRGHGDSDGICGFGYRDAPDILEWMYYVDKRKETRYRKSSFWNVHGSNNSD